VLLSSLFFVEHRRESMEGRYKVEFSLAKDPDDDYEPTYDLELWINGFKSVSETAAALVPPPDPDEWLPCTCNCFEKTLSDSKLAALRTGTLEEVKEAFTEPRDLLRWMGNPADGDGANTLDIALIRGDVEMLQHLVQVSPIYFMQLLGMISSGCPTKAPLMWGIETKQKNVISWMCEAGIMTDTLFAHMMPEGPHFVSGDGFTTRFSSALEEVRKLKESPERSELAIALEAWSSLPEHERKGRTEAFFCDLIWPDRTIVSISAKSLPESGNTEVECLSPAGEFLAKIDVDVSAPELIGNIAKAIEKPKGSITVALPNGSILKASDIDQPLSFLLEKGCESPEGAPTAGKGK